ncbi:MAG TPA: 3,4-dihydroxy-2-butanone-4-phosphate synthase [Candidatus Thermoplasmatota archaeon]|nr:3,4-dihydroxy-2-butanone-4-phosphate synthase [Candidatus Thermoplasmatota archaeon]
MALSLRRGPWAAVSVAGRLLAQGKPILLYDDDKREREVDLFFDARLATPATLRALRQDAGGLVFLAVPHEIAAAFGLPFLHDLLQEAAPRHPLLARLSAGGPPYDARSSFSLTLNHRETYTGITDADRARTVSRFAVLARLAEGLPDPAHALASEFRSPGHVHVCVAARGLLAERRGHTELAVALAMAAGVGPVLVGAEMLSEDGGARTVADAAEWARRNGTVLLRGREVEAALAPP